MPTYPTVKYLDAMSFTETVEDNAVSQSKMEGGYVISRPRFTRRPRRTFTYNYTDMNDTDKATYLAFWNSVFGTSNAFTWVHPATGENINVRFATGMKLKFSRMGFGPVNIWQTDPVMIEEV